MKILVVMPLAEQKGGGELMLWHLAKYGRSKGVEWVFVFLENGPMVGQLRDLGDVEVRVVEAGRMRDLHKMARAVGEIARIARTENVDVLCGWMGTGHLYGGLAARKAGKKAVWYQLGIPLSKDLIDRIVARIPASGIIACSLAGKHAQEQIVPRRPMRVVYPGVELDRFDLAVLPAPEEARKQVGLPQSVPIIGMVGRLQRWKGMHVLVEALPAVLQKHPDARAVIVGGRHDPEAPYEEFVKQKIRDLNLGNTVQMVGLQKNVPEWMQAMDVVVHASDHEPFGIVIIEAMALKKPVVAGAAAGPTEIITPNVQGQLTPYGDAPALANAIIRYLDDRAWAAQIGEAGYVRAHEFGAEQYAQNVITAVKELTAPAL